MGMVLTGEQVKVLADRTRAMPDEALATLFLSGAASAATRTIDPPPDMGRSAATKPRKAKVDGVKKAPTKTRAPRSGSGVEIVYQDLLAHEGTGVAGILERTGLKRGTVGAALRKLKDDKRVVASGTSKRDMVYAAIGKRDA